jgi:hypothetical protein
MQNIVTLLSKSVTQYLIIFLVGVVFYFNSIPGEYVLDDGLVLFRNEFVKQGIKGIPDIITHDSFYGSIGNSANLNGGRYRPLSLVVFAIEYSIFAENPMLSRLINVLLYALSGLLILFFLRSYVFSINVIAAFIATILFVIHPIHTEVVANIKSLDEILSFTLLISTLYFLLRYSKDKAGIKFLFLSLLTYFLAMLSKENGIIFLIIIPITLYVFTKCKMVEIFNISLAYFLVIACYVLMRFQFIGFKTTEVIELMDNPFMLATTLEKYATITYIFLKYLLLLLFPHPLTYDYGYNQIPYTTFLDWKVILSIIINGSLFLFALYKLKSKSIYSWAILFHFASLFLVSNLAINIGAPMGERFLYQSSLMLAIVIVKMFLDLFKKYSINTQTQSLIIILILIPVFTLSFIKTYSRNKIWLKGETLGLTDVQVSNNSARALTYAGINKLSLCDAEKDSSTKIKLIKESIPYLEKSISIHPQFGIAYENLGIAYFRLGDIEKAGELWLQESKMNVGVGTNLQKNLQLISPYYFNKGLIAGTEKKYTQAISNFKKSLEFNINNAEVWYNLGGAYYTIQKYDSAKLAWQNALVIKPDMNQAQQALLAIPKK